MLSPDQDNSRLPLNGPLIGTELSVNLPWRATRGAELKEERTPMQTNSLVTILALFQLLCGVTLAQKPSIGSKNEMPQSLVEVQNAAASSSGTFPGNSWKQVSSLEGAGWSKDKLAAARNMRTRFTVR